MWKCKQCGKCCQFIVIPVDLPISDETMEYLEAHNIVVEDNKLLIPAKCNYLTEQKMQDGRMVSECKIHAGKFKNCKAGGKRECEEAQRQWSLLHPK